MSRVTAQAGPRMRVLGDRAAFVKYGLDGQEAALAAGGRPYRPDWGEEPPAEWGHLGVDGDIRTVPTQPGAYQDFYAGAVAALRDGGAVPVDPEDSLNGLLIIEASLAGCEGLDVSTPSSMPCRSLVARWFPHRAGMPWTTCTAQISAVRPDETR